MANRRMFSLDVVDTDKFLDMPATSQNLYFHLGMRADDDGFVSSPRKITKLVNCGNDDLNVLVSRGFVLPVGDGIVVITHWKQNNYIQKDRYKPTIYQKEVKKLVEKGGVYELDTECIQDVSKMETQVRIGKDSIVEDRKDVGAEDGENTVANILLNDNTYYQICNQEYEQLQQAYPDLNVRSELLRAAAWCKANPTRRKSRAGIERFIVSWLGRSQKQKTEKEASDEKHTGNNEIESSSSARLW